MATEQERMVAAISARRESYNRYQAEIDGKEEILNERLTLSQELKKAKASFDACARDIQAKVDNDVLLDTIAAKEYDALTPKEKREQEPYVRQMTSAKQAERFDLYANETSYYALKDKVDIAEANYDGCQNRLKIAEDRIQSCHHDLDSIKAAIEGIRALIDHETITLKHSPVSVLAERVKLANIEYQTQQMRLQAVKLERGIVD